MYVPILPDCEVLYELDESVKPPHRSQNKLGRLSLEAIQKNNQFFAETLHILPRVRRIAPVAMSGGFCLLLVGNHSRAGNNPLLNARDTKEYTHNVEEYLGECLGSHLVHRVNNPTKQEAYQAIENPLVTSVVFMGHATHERMQFSNGTLGWWGTDDRQHLWRYTHPGFMLNLGCGSTHQPNPANSVPVMHYLAQDHQRVVGFRSNVESSTLLTCPESYLNLDKFDLQYMHNVPVLTETTVAA